MLKADARASTASSAPQLGAPPLGEAVDEFRETIRYARRSRVTTKIFFAVDFFLGGGATGWKFGLGTGLGLTLGFFCTMTLV